MAIAKYILEAASLIPLLIQAGMSITEVIGFWNKTNDAINKMKEEGRNPTDEEWNIFDEKSAYLKSRRPDLTLEE